MGTGLTLSSTPNGTSIFSVINGSPEPNGTVLLVAAPTFTDITTAASGALASTQDSDFIK